MACQLAAFERHTAPIAIITTTTLGCLLVFATDHLAQQLQYESYAIRHIAPPNTAILFIALMLGLSASTLAFRDRGDWLWLIGLGVAGGLYAYVASRKGAFLFGAKEWLGACCFTWVVWGRVDDPATISILGFWLLAFSNFIWSSFFDRHRDQTNGHRTIATRVKQADWMARLVAFLAMPLLVFQAHPGLAAVALAHIVWPRSGPHIDWAFLAIVITWTPISLA